MKKIIFSVLLFILIFPIVSSLEACTDMNEIDLESIPCQGITNVISCSGNISIINLNTSIQYNLSTQPLGDGRYNFTFTFNQTGSYSAVDCQNNSASILVGDFPRDDLWKVSMLIAYLSLAVIFISMGYFTFDKQNWLIKSFLYFSGTLVILMGINSGLSLVRVSNIRTIVFTSSILTITFISTFCLYLLIYYSTSVFRAVKESREEKKLQI